MCVDGTVLLILMSWIRQRPHATREAPSHHHAPATPSARPSLLSSSTPAAAEAFPARSDVVEDIVESSESPSLVETKRRQCSCQFKLKCFK